jgi:hypothetical protein
MEGGSRRSASASTVCNAMSRGLVAVERSMFARQTLSSELTAALTIPGRFLMASNSPRLEPARAARTASWSFSGSIGCRNPPARRPASCPMVMTCTPLAPLLPAAIRIMCPDSLVWTMMVRRAVMCLNRAAHLKCGLHRLLRSHSHRLSDQPGILFDFWKASQLALSSWICPLNWRVGLGSGQANR